MHIKILGTGCRNCLKLEEQTRVAVAELGIEATIEKVTELADIGAYGIMSTPGLVVDEEVVSYGKVLKASQIKPLLQGR